MSAESVGRLGRASRPNAAESGFISKSALSAVERCSVVKRRTDAWCYTYDRLDGRLIGAERWDDPGVSGDPCMFSATSSATWALDYDANGNRTYYADGTDVSNSPNIQTDMQDRLLQYGSATMTYDAIGTLEFDFWNTVGGGWFTRTLDYDIHGELLSAVVDNSGAITSITYDQDALGRRTGRAVTTGGGVGGGGGGGGGSTTEQVRWTYKDAINPVAAFDDADRITAHYVYFPSGHVPELVVR